MGAGRETNSRMLLARWFPAIFMSFWLVPDASAAVYGAPENPTKYRSEALPYETQQPDKTEISAPLIVGFTDAFAVEDLWSAIIKEAGITVERLEGSISAARRRRMFLDGLIMLDCCMIPAWRNTDEENAAQIWSDVFYQSEEVFIFPRGKIVPITQSEDLRALRVAVIRGFTYKREAFFGVPIPAVDVEGILSLLEAGRAQVAIVSKADFQARMEAQPRALEIGAVESSNGLRIRVHKTRADLLPRINAAIAKLKIQGVLTLGP